MNTDYLPQATIEKLCSALKRGNFRSVACAHARLSLKVFNAWMEAGEREDGTLSAADQFRCAVIEAETEAEMLHVESILNSGDAEMQKWWLSRRHPKRWDKRETKKRLTEEERQREELTKQSTDKLLAALELMP